MTLETLLSVSLLTTADCRAWRRAATKPSHSLSLCRASAPSELTFLQKTKNTAVQTQAEFITSWQQSRLPQASWSVLKDSGPLSALWFGWVGRVSPPPAWVWDDDFVRQGLKSLVDDGHFERLVWWEVPQSTCGVSRKKVVKAAWYPVNYHSERKTVSPTCG